MAAPDSGARPPFALGMGGYPLQTSVAWRTWGKVFRRKCCICGRAEATRARAALAFGVRTGTMNDYRVERPCRGPESAERETADMTDTTTARLASGFAPATYEKWRQLVDKALKGGDFDKKLVAKTADGLRIEPLYTRADTLPGAASGGTGQGAVHARHACRCAGPRLADPSARRRGRSRRRQQGHPRGAGGRRQRRRAADRRSGAERHQDRAASTTRRRRCRASSSTTRRSSSPAACMASKRRGTISRRWRR